MENLRALSHGCREAARMGFEKAEGLAALLEGFSDCKDMAIQDLEKAEELARAAIARMGNAIMDIRAIGRALRAAREENQDE